MTKYCYFNNGLSFIAVEKEYEPQQGEVIFDEMPETADLTEKFPVYAQKLQNQQIAEEIYALEKTQTPRRMRDTSDAGRAWLANLETEIEALRAKIVA